MCIYALWGNFIGFFSRSVKLAQIMSVVLEGEDQRGFPLVAAKPGPLWSQQFKQNFAYNRNHSLKYWQLHLKQDKKVNLHESERS